MARTHTRLVCLALLALAAVVVRAQVPAGQTMPSGQNVLLGRIVEMTTGEPVPGALVSLTGYFDAAGKPAATLPQTGISPLASTPRSVLTTPDGYFVFRGLATGNYSVSAAAYGFVAANYPRQVVEVTAGDRPSSVTMRMWQVGAIAGRVVDDRGEPVVGAPVAALRRVVRGGATVLEQAGAAETDDRGVYRLTQLQPGTYVVAVVASSVTLPMSLAGAIQGARDGTGPSDIISELLAGGAPIQILIGGDGVRASNFMVQRRGPTPTFAPDGRMLTYATTLHPGTTDPAQAIAITLASGETRTGIDVPIRFAPTVRVSGVLKGPYGTIEHSTVMLAPPYSVNTVTTLDSNGLATAITDDDGAFAFLDVAPGQYVLKSVIANEADFNEGTPAVALSAAQQLTVGETDVTGLTLMMQQGARVSGRIEFVGESVMPAMFQGPLIGFRPAGATTWRTLRGTVTPNGTFSTLGGPPGRYVINAPSLPGWFLLSVSRGSRVLPDDVLELGTTDIADLVVTFSRKATRLTGTVVTETGAVDADADIVVFPSDSDVWRDGTGTRRVRVTRATTLGRFEITELPPGDYCVVAVINRWTMDSTDPALLERVIAGATKFSLIEGDQRTVALKSVVVKK